MFVGNVIFLSQENFSKRKSVYLDRCIVVVEVQRFTRKGFGVNHTQAERYLL